MAAGLGFKDFVTGEVLTASDVDGYLMQGIWVFASAAARDSAVTSPQEGNFAYLKDTNTTTYYTGSAWTNLDTTGMVNPMTTTGDTIYSSSGSTPARLGIGSTGQVLTVSGGLPSWQTPAGGGGKVLQVVSTTYSTQTTIATNTYTDTGLSLSITPTSNTSKIMAIVSQPMAIDRDSSVGIYADFRLMRDSTSVYDVGNTLTLFAAKGTTFNLTIGVVMAISYLDSPATTSATTYKTQSKTSVANTTVTLQGNGYPSSLILMEIGA